MESEREQARREHAQILECIEEVRRRNREMCARVEAGLAESRRLSEEGRRLQIKERQRAAARRWPF